VVNICNSKLNPRVSLPAKYIYVPPIHHKNQPEIRKKHATAGKTFNCFGTLRPVYEDKTVFVNIWKINKLFSSKLKRKGVKTANKEKLKNRLENPARSQGDESRWALTQAGSKVGWPLGSVKEIFAHYCLRLRHNVCLAKNWLVPEADIEKALTGQNCERVNYESFN